MAVKTENRQASTVTKVSKVTAASADHDEPEAFKLFPELYNSDPNYVRTSAGSSHAKA